MRILYLHQYFKTPEQGGALRSYYLATGLVRGGYTVDIITSHNQPNTETKEFEGIRVHYLPVPYSNNMGFRERVWAFFRFVWLASKQSRRLDRADLCYCSSSPLTIGLVALFLKWTSGIEFIFEVRDLWPDAPIQLGAITNPLAKKGLYYLERSLYWQSKLIVALSPGIQQTVQAKAPGNKVIMIPNMADCDFLRPQSRSDLLDPFNTAGKLVICYAGALGPANRVESMLNLALACRDLPVLILILGEGSEKSKLMKSIGDAGLENTRFLGHQDRMGINEILQLSDAVLVSFREAPVLRNVSPNKFFDGLAAGKLIIVNIRGWIKDLVEENSCGFYWSGHSIEELRPLLMDYIHNPAKLAQAQKNSRHLAESRFSRVQLTQEWLKSIASALPDESGG